MYPHAYIIYMFNFMYIDAHIYTTLILWSYMLTYIPRQFIFNIHKYHAYSVVFSRKMPAAKMTKFLV